MRKSATLLLSLFVFFCLVFTSACGSGGSKTGGNGGGTTTGGQNPPPTDPNAVTVSISVTPTSIAAGQTATLTWSSTNATSVTIDNGVGTVAVSGSVAVQRLANTTFTATATGAGGKTATATAALTVTPAPGPAVTLSVSQSPVISNTPITLSWTSVNATSITFNPVLTTDDDAATFGVNGSFLVTPTCPGGAASCTVTYTATVTDANGATGTGSVNVVVDPNAPFLAFAASGSNIMPGQQATLNWNTRNITSLTIDNGVGAASQLPVGSVKVSPTTTTTYTATGVGPLGTVTASATVTLPAPGTLAVQLKANPPSIGVGQATTVTWVTQAATSVSIDNGIGNVGASGTASVSPTANTTYTLTATDASGATQKASVFVRVNPTGDPNQIKHIIFFVQENRSFDNYFGQLGKYRASKGFSDPFDGTPNGWALPDKQGNLVNAYHFRTTCHDNLPPSWSQSHADIDASCKPAGTGACAATAKMDKFLIKAQSTANDPNGHRAIGYYNEQDLPYYYELATQFATSDRWYSPLLGPTVPNRMYLFAGTSAGHIHSDLPPSGGFTTPTIFQRLREAGITWRYYYQDNSVFLAQYNDWPIDQANVYPLSTFAQHVQNEATLPQVIFIERASDLGLDEHPGPKTNIQAGAANSVKPVIDALMNSPSWASSAFILTYDEGGGLADHAQPFAEPAPDNIAPITIPGDAPGDFTISGFRIPLIVISPWVRPHYVSHVNRDHTAILKFIETRFGIAPLTARDASQDDMYEFFDFSSPHMLTIPPLPAQPTNGTCDFTQELEPQAPPPPPASTAPTITFSASPTSITSGSTSTLTWSSTNATSVTISDGTNTTSVATSGTMNVTPTANTTYTATATASDGTTATKSVTVTVSSSSSSTAPTITFSANPTTIAAGGSSQLTWSSTNASSVTISDGNTTQTVATSGNMTVSPTTTTTYTATATASDGTTAKATATVTVQ